MNYRKIQPATPFLIVDLDKVRENYRRLQSTLPEVEIYYAMKANPEVRIVEALINEGCGVEVTSRPELGAVQALGLLPGKIISSNPIKEPRFLETLHSQGVSRLVFDSQVEVDKIARYAPGSQVYLRIKTDNAGSDWPLSNKFGADLVEAPALLHYAADKGLVPFGLTFHVGSQCLNPGNWTTALQSCAWVMEQVAGRLRLEVINLGGGLPIQHVKPIPALAEIAETIHAAQRSLFDESLRYHIEPGRFLVGDAATLVTMVIGKATRNGESWLYLDAGVYNGLMETIEQFGYAFAFDVEAGRKQGEFTIAGPSCDSLDTMFKGQVIPDLQVGERFYVLNAGAYTGSYASHFNGFAPPAVVYTDELAALPQAGADLGTVVDRGVNNLYEWAAT